MLHRRKQHLAAVADGAESIKVAGCVLPVQKSQRPLWQALEEHDTQRLRELVPVGTCLQTAPTRGWVRPEGWSGNALCRSDSRAGDEQPSVDNCP